MCRCAPGVSRNGGASRENVRPAHRPKGCCPNSWTAASQLQASRRSPWSRHGRVPPGPPPPGRAATPRRAPSPPWKPQPRATSTATTASSPPAPSQTRPPTSRLCTRCSPSRSPLRCHTAVPHDRTDGLDDRDRLTRPGQPPRIPRLVCHNPPGPPPNPATAKRRPCQRTVRCLCRGPEFVMV